MKTVIVIPARYASVRYPGKPLVDLVGCNGTAKSLIKRSWDAACEVSGVDRVVVATDDDRIRSAAEGFGAEVIMTSATCANGTERCSDALASLTEKYDIVVNLQGDAPLTPAWFVKDLISAMVAKPSVQVATPVLRCDGRALNGFLEDRKADRVGGTTAVFQADNTALYFSKEVIPFTAETYADADQTPVFHHVGVYAFRTDALARYTTLPVGKLEALEGLEQLRFMENGIPVHCVEVEGQGRAFWELNNPEDVAKIEEILCELEIE